MQNSEQRPSRTERPDHLSIGQTYGKLTVTAVYLEVRQDAKARYLAQAFCACGANLERVWLARLTSGRALHCGCQAGPGVSGTTRYAKRAANSAHDKWVYSVWQSVLDRTTNPKHKAYSLYKDRAPIDPDWFTYAKFKAGLEAALLAKHGRTTRLPHESLDREDNNKPYAFDNIRLATRKTQALNRGPTKLLKSLAGRLVSFRELYDLIGCTLKYNTAYARFFVYNKTLSESLAVSKESLIDFPEFPAILSVATATNFNT